MSDTPGIGVHGAFYSAVIANLDNWRRFTTPRQGGALSLPELYGDPRIGGKCVLHILDALAVTFGGGPGPNPHNSAIHKTLYASRDPVAVDSLGLRLLEKWRFRTNLGPIGAKASWLRTTNAGNSDEQMMILSPAR